MTGDVYLLLMYSENNINCEIEIMIAESKYRRQGFAIEALNLMMNYGKIILIS